MYSKIFTSQHQPHNSNLLNIIHITQPLKHSTSIFRNTNPRLIITLTHKYKTSNYTDKYINILKNLMIIIIIYKILNYQKKKHTEPWLVKYLN